MANFSCLVTGVADVSHFNHRVRNLGNHPTNQHTATFYAARQLAELVSGTSTISDKHA